MKEALDILSAQAAVLFAATILCVVFFLIARVWKARQPVALAFALMPLLLAWAVAGVAAGSNPLV
jgi:hypothetical protein